MKKITTLTDEEQNRIADYAMQVFDECAYDLFTAVAEEKRKSVYEVTIPRSHAIEIALDAGRLEERMRNRITPDLMARWEALDYDQKQAVAKRRFTNRRYGM